MSLARKIAARMVGGARPRPKPAPLASRRGMEESRPSPILDSPIPAALRLPAPPPSPEVALPPPAIRPGWRGTCQAVNSETGRRCCLLAGHTDAHAHGRTRFWRAAEPGQTHFARRDALDTLGTSRTSGTTDTTQGASL